MRRASAVSVSGTILLALLCISLISLLPNPAGAQQNDLAGQPASIQDNDNDEAPDRIEIPFPEGQTCIVNDDADVVRITVNDGDTNTTFTEDATSTITVIQEEDQIVITAQEEDDNLTVRPGFEETEDGEVVRSDGIECTEDAADPEPPEPPAAPVCPTGTEQVVTFDSDDDSVERFRITQEELRVLYAVRGNREVSPGNRRFVIEVRQGGERVARHTETEVPPRTVRDSLTVDDLGSGRLQINVDGENVVFAVTVCQEDGDDGNGGGGGNGNGGNGDDLNCDDFDSQGEAQDVYDANPSDPNNLDADDDGTACEDFPYGQVMDDDNDDEELPETGGPPLLPIVAALTALATLVAFSALRVQTDRRR